MPSENKQKFFDTIIAGNRELCKTYLEIDSIARKNGLDHLKLDFDEADDYEMTKFKQPIQADNDLKMVKLSPIGLAIALDHFEILTNLLDALNFDEANKVQDVQDIGHVSNNILESSCGEYRQTVTRIEKLTPVVLAAIFGNIRILEYLIIEHNLDADVFFKDSSSSFLYKKILDKATDDEAMAKVKDIITAQRLIIDLSQAIERGDNIQATKFYADIYSLHPISAIKFLGDNIKSLVWGQAKEVEENKDEKEEKGMECLKPQYREEKILKNLMKLTIQNIKSLKPALPEIFNQLDSAFKERIALHLAAYKAPANQSPDTSKFFKSEAKLQKIIAKYAGIETYAQFGNQLKV